MGVVLLLAAGWQWAGGQAAGVAAPVSAYPAGPAAPAALPLAPPEAYRQIAAWPSQAAPEAPGAFLAPEGVDVAPDGRVYVADAKQGRVHVLEGDGTPRALWKVGDTSQPTDVAVAGGVAYVTDPFANEVVLLGLDGAELDRWPVAGGPTSVAVDGSRVYVATAESPAVRVLGLDGHEVGRWGAAGNPFGRPRGVAVGPDGRVYVADYNARSVWVFDDQGVLSGALQVVEDGGAAAPVDVAVDSAGEVFVPTERRVHRLRDGQEILADFRSPGGRGVAIGPAFGLVVSAQDDQLGFTGLRVFPDRRLALSPPPELWGNPFAALGLLDHPRRISANADGHVFVLDDWPRIQDWSSGGQPGAQFGTQGLGDIAAGVRGSVYGLDGRTVHYWTASGDPVWTWQPPSTRPESGPITGWLTGLDSLAGDVAVVDAGDQRLHLLDYFATPTGSWPIGPAEIFTAIGDVGLGADRVYLVNRTSRLVEARDRGSGAQVAQWTVPGTALRLDVGADGAVYLLTREGWVWKCGPDGSVLAAWPVADAGQASDLAVGDGGRVYVTFEDTLQVIVYAPDPGAIPPEIPGFPNRCTLSPDKTASPGAVQLGAAVTVRLNIDGTCPLADAKADVLLLVDTSGSMNGSKMAAARTAALSFVGQLDYGLSQVGLVSFGSVATLRHPLSSDPRNLLRIIPILGDEGGTSMYGAMLLADQELGGPRARPGARPVVILLTDGNPTDGYDEILTLAARFRSQGREVYAVGLGLDVARGFLRQLATLPNYYFEAPSPYDLNRIYDTIARRVAASQLLSQVTVTDELPANMRFEAGSAVPPARYDAPRRTLTWDLSNVPSAGLALRYRLTPQEVGRWPTNVRAAATFVDGVGFAGQLTFPVPAVDVTAPERWTAFLPLLLRRQCPEVRADVVLAFDTSSSMQDPAPGGGTKLDAALHAGRVFVGQLRLPADQVGVLAFHARAQVVQPLTGDPAAAVRALASLPGGTGTRLDLGLASARALLNHTAPNRVRVVVLLTDGRQSGAPETAVLQEAAATQAAGIIVYTVGLGHDTDRALLAEVAGTPDRAFTAPTEADLAHIYREIADAIPCQ